MPRYRSLPQAALSWTALLYRSAVDVLEGYMYPLVEDLTTLHNTTQDAFTILDQRSAGLRSSGLGAIPVLRPNVQPPATATTTERRLGLGLVPAAVRRR